MATSECLVAKSAVLPQAGPAFRETKDLQEFGQKGTHALEGMTEMRYFNDD